MQWESATRAAMSLCGLLLVAVSLSSLLADEKPAAENEPQESQRANSASDDEHTTESLRGRVVWYHEAIARLHGVQTDADAQHTIAALETSDGRLVPIMKDARGRGFHLDKRIRGIDMELFVRRYEGCPSVQVIRIYTLKEGRKYLFDYWCDICAIPMYELKECECCQGPIRIRERRVTKDGVQPEQ